ncbi:hypothetical protein BC835DRAFT_428799 [Cytidiella melzeri]|nr:hypothetical protein BC835DRAFT_428799 [Cytidiella melzeri]
MSYYCNPCNRWFVSYNGLRQHQETSSWHQSYYCDSCNREFYTEDALTQHWIHSSRHAYCSLCDEHFDDYSELEDHQDNKHWYCHSCDEFFYTEEDIDEHMEESHWYCKSCDRVFQTWQGLDMHLRTSKIHNQQIHRCPGRGCEKSFVAYGDLALHLESGTCPSGATRRAINNHVVRVDRDNIITNPSRLIAYHESSPVLSTSATSASWNGRQYECFLCHMEFRELPSLNAHLRSPAHDQEIYRCPTAYNGCGREFKTLSGLLSHVERSECGVTRFRGKVHDYLDDVTAGMGRLTF